MPDPKAYSKQVCAIFQKIRHFRRFSPTKKFTVLNKHTQQPTSNSTIYLYTIGFFVFVAFYVRFSLGYPICKNDELNWIFIASQLDQGVSWPVSGPLFIAMMREASKQLNMSYASVMPWLGVSGSLALICGLCWGYCKLGIIQPWKIFSALMLSSYFWAPLLEARPQQWGQLFVFLGSISTWLWLQNRRGGWTLLPIVFCLGFTHILSHAIMLCICAALVFFDLSIKRRGNYRHFSVLLVAAASAGIYFWPAGPYAAMLVDLSQVHLKGVHFIHIVLLAIPLILTSIASAHLLRSRDNHFTKMAIDFLERNFISFITTLTLLLIILVIMQAYLLPAQAWLPYQGSWIKFIVFQIGNITFAALCMTGLCGLYIDLRHRDSDTAMVWFVACILTCFAVLGVAAVVLSFWTHDTNWFLRLINYGILFAAIPAAIGLKPFEKKMKFEMIFLWWFGVISSLISVVRPQSLLGC